MPFNFILRPKGYNLYAMSRICSQLADKGLWPLKEWKQSAPLFAGRGDDMYLSRLAPFLEGGGEAASILLMPNWSGF